MTFRRPGAGRETARNGRVAASVRHFPLFPDRIR